ncbi:MAG: UPF0149 family protein [Gammaproteobacteria bacterium]
MVGNFFYAECQQGFDNEGSGFSLAEAHGIMTAMLCVDESIQFEQWQSEMTGSGMPADAFDGRFLESLMDLFENTRATFVDDGFEFSPCLPEAEVPVGERARALGEWCQGFLHGLGHADIRASWPGQCREIIADLIAITRVDPDSDGEDDEESLMELTEYVRVAVELIRIDLKALYDPEKIN